MPRPWKAIHFPKRHAMTGQGDKRACKWCGGGMEGKTARAVFCCVKCVNTSYRRANAERIAERMREYRRANAERIAERKREYREANVEKIAERKREYREANAERIAEYNREYREANAEYDREYRRANAEKIAEYDREYYQENVERILERQREYINNRIAAASTLSLAHTVSQFTADPPNRNVTPAQDKTP